MSAPDAPKQIEFVHSIHPDNAAYFNSLAPSSKDIRNARSTIQMICTTCRKSEEELGGQLRKCGKVRTSLLAAATKLILLFPAVSRRVVLLQRGMYGALMGD
jgi:hypothetical protein